jgi:cell division protein FtsB
MAKETASKETAAETTAETKKAKPKKRRSKMTLVFLVFWAVVIGLTFMMIVNQAGDYNELRAEADHLAAQIAQGTAHNEDLEFQIDFFDNDAYIEQQARDRLRMVRPDEIVFRNIAAE